MTLMSNCIFSPSYFIIVEKEMFKVYPLGQSVKHVGENMTYRCDIAGPIVKWYFSKSSNPKNGVFISKVNTYKIYNITIKDEGYYYCYGQYPNHNKNNPHHFLSYSSLIVYGWS